MDVLQKIKELLNQYGWSVYKLSIESGVPQSTLANMFSRNNLPTIPTLEMICNGFGITLSDFFDDKKQNLKLSEEQSLLLRKYQKLSENKKRLMIELLDNL